jgi:hypothetical protein
MWGFSRHVLWRWIDADLKIQMQIDAKLEMST